MDSRTIADWVARVIVWIFYIIVGAAVTTLIAALISLAYMAIGWQGFLGIVSGFFTIVVFVWAFERNSDRKRNERQYKQMYPTYSLDQQLDKDESLL